jgi:membrane protease subunit HflC
MRKFGIAILVVLILVIAVGSTIAFTVSEREYAIVTRFGRRIQTISDAGLYFKWGSLCDTVTRIDKRLTIFQTRPIELLLGDQNPIIMTCYVCWEVNEPVAFYGSLMTPDNANVKLRDMIQSSLGSILSNYQLQDVINIEPEQVKLREIEAKTLADFASKASKEYGITVQQLGIRRIAYPPMVTQAVHNRMRSEREKEAKKYRGQGREAAAKIEAETDKQVAEILAKAYSEAETTRGEGDSQATRIYAEAYSQDREFFDFLRSLEAYREVLAKQATVVLSTKSRLFKYLVPTEEMTPASQPAGR